MTDHSASQRRLIILLSILCAILIIANIVQAYWLMDSAVTITYQQQGQKDLTEDLATLRALVPKAAPQTTRKDLVYLLRKSNNEAFIVDSDSSVSVGQLVFRFNQKGRLDTVDSR